MWSWVCYRVYKFSLKMQFFVHMKKVGFYMTPFLFLCAPSHNFFLFCICQCFFIFCLRMWTCIEHTVAGSPASIITYPFGIEEITKKRLEISRPQGLLNLRAATFRRLSFLFQKCIRQKNKMLSGAASPFLLSSLNHRCMVL